MNIYYSLAKRDQVRRHWNYVKYLAFPRPAMAQSRTRPRVKTISAIEMAEMPMMMPQMPPIADKTALI